MRPRLEMIRSMDSQYVKAILFDLDGVLVHSYRAWFHLLNAVAEEFGYPKISEDQYSQAWGQSVEDDIEHFFPGLSPQVLSKYFKDHFFEFSEYIRADSAAGKMLKSVKATGYKTAVITNTPTALAVEILEKNDLTLDCVVGSGDVENDKPYPDIVIEACRQLNVRTDEVVVVGDSEFDRVAAQSAGVLFIGFGRKGDYSVESLGELPALLERISGINKQQSG